MKKLIGVILLCAMLLSAMIVCVQADETEYLIIPELEKYLVENIDHYFLPQGYDIRWCVDGIESQEEFLAEYEDKKIIVPFVVDLCTMEENAEIHMLNYNEFLKSSPELKMTNEMVRTFYLGNESAIRSFVAPWTLYNAKTGELYTWLELMEMTESQLEDLDFKNPDFEKFITNVKSELEVRGWWKEEYQSKYDILYSHKDDYKNTFDKNESFVINGVTYNFATMNYEFNTQKNASSQNITCVNIHSVEFKEIYKAASGHISDKYSDMFEKIEEIYNSVPAAVEYYGSVYGQQYMHSFIQYIPSLTEEQKKEIQDKTFYELFEVYFNYDISRNDIEFAMVEYNYIALPWAKFESTLMNEFFNAENKYEALEIFVSEYGLLLNEESFEFISMIELISPIPYRFNLTDENDIRNIISEIKTKIIDSDVSPKDVEDDIAYLESLLAGEHPSTGENTALYIAIASGAIVAMTSLVIRKKKKIA